MIQSYLKEVAEKIVPELEWTYDYYTGEDNTGTVYPEGGPPGNKNNEVDPRYPQYMVYIRSKDWDLAEYAAHEIRDHFRKITKQRVTMELAYPKRITPQIRTYEVLAIEEMGVPFRVGFEDDIAIWSVNFQVTLREEK